MPRRRWSEEPAECGTPEWKETKKGRRCASICTGGRWKFVKRSMCEGGEEEAASASESSPEVEEFSGVEAPVGRVDPMPLDPIEPMPLFQLVGPTEEGQTRRRRRRR
jgi:hypothetical protein